ncbi:MAG: aminoacyl-tRNA hydrolase [Candidatus Moranbacteria bacterium]|nr:aminoacyl-tRNA hydrolase [Candidatus Moranbacteria bacterium]
MKIIFGLGNPGEKYKDTRHNVGFMLVDKIQQKFNFPEFIFDKKFDSEISKGTIPLLPAGEGARRADEGEKEILLVKPNTFMNNSGQAVRSILDFYKLTAEDIIVIHDDLDINLGEYKIADNSSSAGHNGVQDIIDKLGTQKFTRIRIGIGQNENIPGDLSAETLVKAEDYVLQNFTPEEREKIESISENILEEIKKLTS